MCFTLVGTDRVVVARTELTDMSGVYEFELVSDQLILPGEDTTTTVDHDHDATDDVRGHDVVTTGLHRHHDGGTDAGGHRRCWRSATRSTPMRRTSSTT